MNMPITKKRLHKNSGVTLLELVMVIVIIGLMSGLIMPYITQNIDVSAGRRGKMLLISWMRWCQSHSITEQRSYRIIFDMVNDAYTIQRYDGISFEDVETVVLQEGAHLKTNTFPGGILQFDQFGAPTPSGGVIYVCNIDNLVSAISVSNTIGSISVQNTP